MQRAGEPLVNAVGTSHERSQPRVLKETNQGADANGVRLLEDQVGGRGDPLEESKTGGRFKEVAERFRGGDGVATTLPVVKSGRGQIMLLREGAQGGVVGVMEGLVEQRDDFATVIAESLWTVGRRIGSLAGRHGSCSFVVVLAKPP